MRLNSRAKNISRPATAEDNGHVIDSHKLCVNSVYVSFSVSMKVVTSLTLVDMECPLKHRCFISPYFYAQGVY